MKRALNRATVIPIVALPLMFVSSLTAIAQEIPPETPDPVGDTIDFGGNPAEGPDLIGVTAVEVTDFEGGAAWDLIEDIFGFVAGPGVVTVIPEDPGSLLSGTGPLVLVNARLSQPLPDAQHCQIVIAFTTEGLEQYSGADGDPNNGNDTTLDVFLENGRWVSGRTEYRGGSFSFVGDYNEIAAYISDDVISVVFPREAIPDGATWQIWVICGDNHISAGRDFTDLGSFVPGVVPTVSVLPPTTTTVTEPEITTTTVEETETTSPSTTVAAVATDEPEDGGGSTVLLIVALSLALGAGLLWFLVFRKKEGPCDCEMEKAAYDAAVAGYAAAESDLSAARQLVDDWRGRESEARSAIVSLDALRPRPGEITDPGELEAADAEYRERRAELEDNAAECSAQIAEAEESVRSLKGEVAERWEETQSWLAIVRACWEKCFEAPFVPPTVPTPPGGSGEPGVDGGEADSGDDPRDTPPPGGEPECSEPQTREKVEKTATFTIPVDGMVRVSLSTDRGPLDDLRLDVTDNPFADLIAELLAPDGSLELAPESLTGRNAQRWQDAVGELRALSFSVLKREIYVNIAFDVEDVTVDCVRSDVCRGSKWVTVGRRTDETSRVLRTISHRWSESDSGGRPLGATMTIVNSEYQKVATGAKALSEFRAACR